MTIGFLSINSKSLSYSILFDKVGHQCFFYDENEETISELNNKYLPYIQNDINIQLLNTRNLSGSTEVTEVIKNSETIFCFIDCPSNTDNTIDTSEIFKILQYFYLSSHLDIPLFGKNIIISTVWNPYDYKIIYEKISQFGMNLAYMPNFLTEGNTLESLLESDYHVIGTNSTDLSNQISNLLRQIKQKNSEILIMSPESAELVKLGISSIVANKIVTANLIGDLMTSMGIQNEIPLVLNSISKDRRIGSQNLNYGLSFGGPHLGKELRAFSEFLKTKKVEINIFDAIDKANDEHIVFLKYYYMTLNPNKNIPFNLDSITYKKGVNIVEDSQRLKLCLELLNEGYSVNVLENTFISENFLKLSESYDNKLKFFQKGSKPEGVNIKI